MRILIAPDKFKGTLTAEEAATAIARGWRRARRRDVMEHLPISDGGDGFGELLGQHLGAERRQVDTQDAAGRALSGTWYWIKQKRLAIVESAAIIGLALLPRGKHHPFELDTFGLGAVLRDVASHRPKSCLLGIGGSATNDGGFGLARSLGWRFRDRNGELIEEWPRLSNLETLTPPRTRLRLGDLIVAVDVQNRLLGARGATKVFGPQKGIRPEDIGNTEKALRRLARIWQEATDAEEDLSKIPGTGAAGGLGFGLSAFCGARLESGFAIFAEHTDLARQVRESDLVITGEGALDLTSVAMGKGVGEVARLCRESHVPCLGLAA